MLETIDSRAAVTEASWLSPVHWVNGLNGNLFVFLLRGARNPSTSSSAQTKASTCDQFGKGGSMLTVFTPEIL